ncbi:MAG: dCTP deaminase [Alphaproteobacteria bacterium]|nr:dCTP deaminase [Alphaproteobacteria bacterium]
MILTGKEIIKQWELGKIDLRPFHPERATTNSYDLALGNRFVQYTSAFIDPKLPPKYREIIADNSGVVMKKCDFLVGHTAEIVGSDHFVPIIHARSSIARLGLFVHVTADLVDLGMHGNLSFQLYATLPIKLYPGMLIGQVSFWVPHGEIELYKGKYQGAGGPRSSEVYRDFKKGEKIPTLEP